VTNPDGSCPSCWAFKDGPRYIIQSPRAGRGGSSEPSWLFFGFVFDGIQAIVESILDVLV
jgi:hypothetical protein